MTTAKLKTPELTLEDYHLKFYMAPVQVKPVVSAIWEAMYPAGLFVEADPIAVKKYNMRMQWYLECGVDMDTAEYMVDFKMAEDARKKQ